MSEPAFDWTDDYHPVCQLGLSDNRQAEPDSWVDVSEHVHQVEIFAGRARFTDRFEPSVASITFANDDGWADLFGSPVDVAEQTLRPGRQLRVGIVGRWGPWGVTNPVTTRWLFRGWVDQTTPQYDPVRHDVVVAYCIDALGEAGSSTAPTGPLQGENETVNARINRILNAVEWFSGKRAIDASATTVIGTQLGASAVDMLGQAAESAGGVVFGDTVGRVVYRELGWQFYDGDTPVDGVIGNVDAGTPPTPFVPGYLDPTKGYVWWPDAPPFTTPVIIVVEPYVPGGGCGPIVEGPDWSLGYYCPPDGGPPVIDWCNSGICIEFPPPEDPTCWAIFWDPTTGEAYLVDCETHEPPPGGPVPGVEIVDWKVLTTAVNIPTDGSGYPANGFLEATIGAIVTEGVVHPDDLDIDGPFILWDTRTWDGGTFIPNTGNETLGSAWDLRVSTAAHRGVTYQIAATDDIDLAGVAPWNNLGGPVDSQPWTIVAAMTTSPIIDGPLTAHAELGAIAQLDMRQDTVGPQPTFQFAFSQARDGDPGANFGRIVQGSIGINFRAPGTAVWRQFNAYLAAGAGPFLEPGFDNSVAVCTIDTPSQADSTAWRNTVADLEEVPSSVDSGGTWGYSSMGSPTIERIPVTFGRGYPVVPSGKWASGVYAFALYRGRPSVADLDKLQTFYSGEMATTTLDPDPTLNALVVFITAHADVDVSEDLQVVGTGLAFAQQFAVAPGAGDSQGAVWLAPLPDGLVEVTTLTFSWGNHDIDGISWTVYGVTNANEPGGRAGVILGDGTLGSVNGPAAMTLDMVPEAGSAILAHIGVRAPFDPDSGAAPATGWGETVESADTEAAGYLQSQVRRVIDDVSPTVAWDDIQSGTVGATSACAMAIEIKAGRGPFVNWAGTGDIVIGSTPGSPPVRAIHVYNPDGTVVWSFTPEAV